MEARRSNRLVSEKSPYLLQHAYNPVDWYAWGEEAFQKAAGDDKPVFLSIGYSTCHWCHVMEKESFEDPDVARLMNETFVSVKVDREERPDLDHIYMSVCQMITGSGGWPLTIFMTPDRQPFFAATYIPRTARFGKAGMMELIPRIRVAWMTRREEIRKSTAGILGALQSMEKDAAGPDMDETVFRKAYQELFKRFDDRYGGFSQAPKFPTPHNLYFLLRYWKRFADESALSMVEKTLQAMRRGGVYDHVGLGFHRYSTDREWLVPHFEKMLYDEALISTAFLEAFQATGKEEYAETAREIFAYVLRDMTSPEGAFYSAEDADSEGVEGKFYVWTEPELREALDPGEADLATSVFNTSVEGNFRDEATGRETGANILHLGRTLGDLAGELGMTAKELGLRMEAVREKLFQVRERRVHPHKDDKVLTDWNGLMIGALARGAKVLRDASYAEAAARAADFILGSMRTREGRLLHRYRDGEAGIVAHLDDYAFLVSGLIELYEATFDTRYLEQAFVLNGEMLDRFIDKGQGGLFFTPEDGEPLIIRKKEAYDGAVPSGNSVAMLNLLKLARITGKPDLESQAASIGRAFASQVRQMPSGYTQWLTSADFALGPSYEVVIAGKAGAPDTRDMLAALQSRFLPSHVVLFRPSDQESPEIDRLAVFVRDHHPVGGKATAYVCRGNACHSPTADVAEMLGFLK
jgi:uncharacterized protein YyaL (SSP411 family)